MRPSEILRTARHKLYEHGWAQRHLRDNEGHLCAIGAINLAAFGTVSPILSLHAPSGAACDASHFLYQAMNEVDPLLLGMQSVSLWNDLPYRTFDQIIEAFEKAEKYAEEKESA